MPPENRAGGDWARAWRDAAPYLSLGTGLAAAVLVGVFLGRYLDRRLGTEPVFFWIGALLGMLSGALDLVRLVKKKQ